MAIPSYLPQQAAVHAYFALEDTADGVAGAHNLTNQGTATFVSGKYGNCVKIESAKYLKYNGTILGQRKGSFSCWVKLYTEIASGQYDVFVNQDAVSGNCTRVLSILYNGGTRIIQARLYLQASTDHVANHTVTLGTASWNQLGWAVDGASGTLNLVLNGVSVNTAATGGSGASSPGNTFGIGSSYAGANYLLGYVDEFVAWDNVYLTPAEWLQVFRGPKTRGFSGFSPWIFMKDMWDKNKKLWTPEKKLILPKDLSFQY